MRKRGNNKIINDDRYFYDKNSKLVKKTSIQGHYWVDSIVYYESEYSVNNYYNIDTVFRYRIIGNQKKPSSIMAVANTDVL